MDSTRLPRYTITLKRGNVHIMFTADSGGRGARVPGNSRRVQRGHRLHRRYVDRIRERRGGLGPGLRGLQIQTVFINGESATADPELPLSERLLPNPNCGEGSHRFPYNAR